MKKILLLLILTLGINLYSIAQCTPDTTITNVIEPPAGSKYDTINNVPIIILPYGYVNQPYDAVLHVKVPTDTTIFGSTWTIDSIELVAMLHKPASLNLSCSPPNCVFIGGSYGCGQLAGTPTAPDSIELEIVVEYTVTFGTASAPIQDTIGNFYLVIKGAPVGLDENSVVNPNVYPNPANKHISIELNGLRDSDLKLDIMSIIGTKVYHKDLGSNHDGTVDINVEDWKPGVYLYSLRSKNHSFSGKFSISR